MAEEKNGSTLVGAAEKESAAANGGAPVAAAPAVEGKSKLMAHIVVALIALLFGMGIGLNLGGAGNSPGQPPFAPGGPQPGQPGLGEPGAGGPQSGEPGMGGPGKGEPGMGGPGMGGPGMGGPGMGGPGMGGPGMGGPGMDGPGMGGPGMDGPGMQGAPGQFAFENGMLATFDKRLEDRLAEVAALERLADVAASRRGGLQPMRMAPERSERGPGVAAPQVAPKSPTVEPPAPALPPGAEAAEEGPRETSAKALARAGSFTTELGPSPAIGSEEAIIRVYIVSDFQCPVCRRAAEGSHELFDQFGDEVQWIFWQNPLDMHRNAMSTAKASVAAFRQGKFWEYHDLLFQNQRAAAPSDLERYATQIGLNMDQFRKDMSDEGVERKLRSDQAVVEKLGARGTPAFVINGQVQVGWGSTAGLGGMVRRELNETRKLIEGGKSKAEAQQARAEANAKTPGDAALFMTHMIGGKAAVREVAQ